MHNDHRHFSIFIRQLSMRNQIPLDLLALIDLEGKKIMWKKLKPQDIGLALQIRIL